MVSGKGKGRKSAKSKRKALTAPESSWLSGAIEVQTLDYAQNQVIERAQAAFKKKFGREISRRVIYKMKKSFETVPTSVGPAPLKKRKRTKRLGRRRATKKAQD
jgi:hypothetical protein